MAIYVLAFTGGGGMPATEEEQQALMAAWGAWYGSMGDAVVDGGNPFGPSRSIAPDGSVTESAASGLSGYTIVKADGLDAATEMGKGSPILAGGGTVDVYETFEVM